MVALTGKVPAGLEAIGLGTEGIELSQDRQGAMLVSQLSAPGTYMTRMARRYAASSATGAGQIPVVAVPTDNVCNWVLFNPVDNSRDIVLERVFIWSISGTLGLGLTMLGAMSLGLQTTAPTNVAGGILTSLSGGVYDSKAILGTAHTMTPVGVPAWCVLASRHQVAAVAVGAGLTTTAQFRGTRVIRPGREFGINILAPVGTDALFGAGFEWYEVDK